MKILNIDELAQVKRQVKWKGVNHDVVETSVQQFIDSLKAAESLESAKDEPEKLSKQIENSVDSILSSIPSMKREDLAGAPFETLTAMMKFIRGELDPDIASKAKPEGEGAAKTSKKKD